MYDIFQWSWVYGIWWANVWVGFVDQSEATKKGKRSDYLEVRFGVAFSSY